MPAVEGTDPAVAVLVREQLRMFVRELPFDLGQEELGRLFWRCGARAASQVRLIARARPRAIASVNRAARMRLSQASVLKIATSIRTATRSAPWTWGITCA